MAEFSSAPKLGLWPTLKKKVGDAKKKKKRKQKVNPFASEGLEKFAALVSELQAKNVSLVDKTEKSVSAVRYLSRSAQEWTATTLARTASRRRERESPKASEVLLLQQSSPSPNILAKERVDIETVNFSQSFSFKDPRQGVLVAEDIQDGSFGFDSKPIMVWELQRETSSKMCTSGDAEQAGESRDNHTDTVAEEEVGCSGQTLGISNVPLKSKRLIKYGQYFLLEKEWVRLPKSALAMLVALGAYVAGGVEKATISVVEGFTVSIVLEQLQNGKLYAEFVQSLVKDYIVPHLSFRVPTRLASLSFIRRKVPEELGAICEDFARTNEETRCEIELVQKLNPGFSGPVVLRSSSSQLPATNDVASSAPATDPESNPSAVSSTSVILFSPDSSGSRSSSPTRRLVKKLSLKLSKVFRSSSSVSNRAATSSSLRIAYESPSLHYSDTFCTPAHSDINSNLNPGNSEDSSSRRNLRLSLSRNGKGKGKEKEKERDKALQQDGTSNELIPESRQSLKRRCSSIKKYSFRKDRTSEAGSSRLGAGRGSTLNRMTSSNELEPTLSTDVTSSLLNVAMSASQAVVKARNESFDIWLVLGLLVALLFLLLGRLPAILALTSLFLVILSPAENSHYRVRGRDRDLSSRHSFNCSLQRSPPA